MYLGRGSSWSRERGTGCEHQLGSLLSDILLSDILYRIFVIDFFLQIYIQAVSTSWEVCYRILYIGSFLSNFLHLHLYTGRDSRCEHQLGSLLSDICYQTFCKITFCTGREHQLGILLYLQLYVEHCKKYQFWICCDQVTCKSLAESRGGIFHL